MADKQRSGGGAPRDLLRHFASVAGDGSLAAEEESGDIELSLGLSLGGTFGVDPRAKRLLRSSSSDLAYTLAPSLSARDVEEEEERRRRQALVRTCSLPVAADDEDERKRRSGLVLGRAEAKRRRDEGEGSGFAAGPWGGVPPQLNSSNNGVEKAGLPQFMGRNGGVISFGTGQGQGQRPQLQPPSQQKQPSPRQILAQVAAQGSRGSAIPHLVSQGSLGSQGSSLTATTPDTETRPSTQGHNRHGGSRDLSTVQRATNGSIEQAASIFPGSSLTSNNSVSAGENQAGSSRSNGSLETDRAIGDQMPSVFTKGDGPNGRIIEGFLYKYKKVEEVRIVCVCHGIFLTPAEFIKHAGGSDVAHPLRHIVVKPPSTSFL